MAIPPESHYPFAPYRMGVRAPTFLMSEILETSKEFQAHVGRELCLNSTDMAAMRLILVNEKMRPTEIARRLGLSTAAVTTVVDRLAALGHVVRKDHPRDRRAIIVEPTVASTQRAASAVMPAIHAIEAVLSEFDDAEQATITRYLERVAAAYRETLPAEP